jgi:hypothetical protein
MVQTAPPDKETYKFSLTIEYVRVVEVPVFALAKTFTVVTSVPYNKSINLFPLCNPETKIK